MTHDSFGLGVDVDSLGFRFAVMHNDTPVPIAATLQSEQAAKNEAGRNGSAIDWASWLGSSDREPLDAYIRGRLTSGVLAAEDLRDAPVKRVALSVPAAFSPEQRQVFYDAAVELGIDDVRVVSHSVALAAERARSLDEGHLLILRCGYHAYETAVISVLGTRIQVLGYGGGDELSMHKSDRLILYRAAMRSFLSPDSIWDDALSDEMSGKGRAG